MKHIFLLPFLLLFLLPAAMHAQIASPDTCLVEGYIYGPYLQRAAGEKVYVLKTIAPGFLTTLAKGEFEADSTGWIRLTLFRNSRAWLYGRKVNGLERSGGVELVIPDAATARIETLVPPVTLSPTYVVAVPLPPNHGDSIKTAYDQMASYVPRDSITVDTMGFNQGDRVTNAEVDIAELFTENAAQDDSIYFGTLRWIAAEARITAVEARATSIEADIVLLNAAIALKLSSDTASLAALADAMYARTGGTQNWTQYTSGGYSVLAPLISDTLKTSVTNDGYVSAARFTNDGLRALANPYWGVPDALFGNASNGASVGVVGIISDHFVRNSSRLAFLNTRAGISGGRGHTFASIIGGMMYDQQYTYGALAFVPYAANNTVYINRYGLHVGDEFGTTSFSISGHFKMKSKDSTAELGPVQTPLIVLDSTKWVAGDSLNWRIRSYDKPETLDRLGGNSSMIVGKVEMEVMLDLPSTALWAQWGIVADSLNNVGISQVDVQMSMGFPYAFGNGIALGSGGTKMYHAGWSRSGVNSTFFVVQGYQATWGSGFFMNSANDVMPGPYACRFITGGQGSCTQIFKITVTYTMPIGSTSSWYVKIDEFN